jgi:hypothetical protein
LDEDRGVIGFDIKVDEDDLSKKVQRATAEKIRYGLRKAISGSEEKCRNHFRMQLENSKVYRALVNEVISPKSIGLMGELGLSDPETTRSAIVSEIVGAFSIRPMTVRSRYKSVTDFGGIEVVIIPTNFLVNLLSSPEASYMSKGGVVTWLYWLLFSGTEVIIADYHVRYGTGAKTSRTDDAIMVPNGRGSNKGFSIVPNYAGTEDDNWITRAAYAALPKIQHELEEAIKKAFS